MFVSKTMDDGLLKMILKIELKMRMIWEMDLPPLRLIS